MIQQPGGVNPNYLQGKQRVVYEILYDLLPDGQGMQILSGEVASPQALGRNAGASLLLMGLTTALGLGEFRRTDLRERGEAYGTLAAVCPAGGMGAVSAG